MAPPTPLDLALFHSYERELYNHLVRRLGRDPERMKWVMALWLWFESIGHHNFIRHIKSYGDQIILRFVEEAEAALDRTAGVQNNSGNEIPLTNALMTSEPIDLGFFDFQKSFAICGVARIYQNVCQIIFDDKLMETVSRDVDHPANESVMSSALIVRPFGKGSTEEGDRIGATVAAAQNVTAEPLVPPGPIAPPPPPAVTGSVLNPMARPWAPGTNSSPEDQSSMFITFSRGFPLTREEITEFFNSRYGPCVKQVMIEKAPPGRRPMYGRIVFNSASTIAAVLNGQQTAKFMIKANVINYGTQNMHANLGWRVTLASAAAPAFFLTTMGSVFLPETPNSIIQCSGDLQKVTKILQRMRGTTDVQKELDDLIAASIESRAIHNPFRLILHKQYWPQLVMAIALPLFQQLTGIDFISFYGPVLFRTIGLKENAALTYAILRTFSAIGFKLIAIVIVDRLGRHALFAIGGVQMLVPLMFVGVIMAAQQGDQGTMREGYAYLDIVLLCLIVGGSSLSWGPLTLLVASEIFPLEIRSAGQSIVVAVALLLKFITAQMSLAMLCHLKFGTFFFFGGWVFVMTLFIHMPIQQTDQVWKEH